MEVVRQSILSILRDSSDSEPPDMTCVARQIDMHGIGHTLRVWDILGFGHGVELALFSQHDGALSYRAVGTSCLFSPLQNSSLSQMTSSWLCPLMVSWVGFLSQSRIQTTTSFGISSSISTMCCATNAQRMSGLAFACQGPAERQYCALLTGIAYLQGTLALIRHTQLLPMHTTDLICLRMWRISCAHVQCVLLPKVRISCEWVQSPSLRFRCNHSPVRLWIS